MKILKRLSVVWLTAVPVPGVALDGPPLDLEPALHARKLESDFKALAIYRSGVARVVEYTHDRSDLFPPARPDRPRLLGVSERDALRRLWSGLLDYYLALDSLGRYHGAFHEIDDSGRRQRAFLIAYGAFLTQYRFALEFIDAADKDPAIDTLLNEPMPDFGLGQDTYKRFKFRFLNVARATEFAALEVVYRALGGEQAPAVRARIRDDAGAIWKIGRGRGEVLTLRNGLDLVRKAGFTAWFPVQAGVAEWMGDVKLLRVDRSLISSEQIARLVPRLEPGDVLLARREWYLSNIGLPGFWPHAAIYIGTPRERRAFFDDPDVRDWLYAQGQPQGDFEALLHARFPRAYRDSIAPRSDGHVPRVVEAISEGVSLTALEHSAAADSLAVLRPRLSKREKAAALLRAYHYHGRPYDFNFDFVTDSALVCTELVFKAYEPRAGGRGLRLPVIELMGRVATPANEIVRQFDEQFGRETQQFDLVVFLDGDERADRAREASLAEFRQSWRRPKWHILVQGTGLDGGTASR